MKFNLFFIIAKYLSEKIFGVIYLSIGFGLWCYGWAELKRTTKSLVVNLGPKSRYNEGNDKYFMPNAK
jgi:hypothetical protein